MSAQLPARVVPILKLNLGCGRVVRYGFVNVDKFPIKEIIPPGDGGTEYLQWDLDNVPWPFQSDSVEYVWASHFLEHVASLERTMHEVHRILRPGGVLEVRVPFGIRSMYNAFHLRPFDMTTLTYFAKTNGLQAQLLFDIEQTVQRGLPCEWHLRKYLPPRIFGPLDKTCRSPRWRFVIGPKREIHAILRKVI